MMQHPSAPDATPLITARNLERSYGTAESRVTALGGIDLDVCAGEFVAITGPSGCGKSTLLHLIGGLDRPDVGELHVAGVAVHAADDAGLTRLRREHTGIIFQFFHLLPTMTVRENTELPVLLAGGSRRNARNAADRLLEKVHLTHRLNHFPHQLSGGEMQRCAIARALAHSPSILLADEPTGNLDSPNAISILDILRELHRGSGLTILLVTHSDEIAESAGRRIRMRDGHIVD